MTQEKYRTAFHPAINHGAQLKDAERWSFIIGTCPQSNHGVVCTMSADKCRYTQIQTVVCFHCNNPMVGATVAVAVAVEEALKNYACETCTTGLASGFRDKLQLSTADCSGV